MEGKITFLGTGTSTGVPFIGCDCEVCTSTDPRDHRLRCSSLIETHGLRLLMDCGPDFRQQAIRHHIYRVDAILLTHKHVDHIAGVDDLRPLGDVHIYLDEQTEQTVRTMYGYCFAENPYPGVPTLTLHRIDYEPFQIQGLTITPIRVIHGKMPILGYRIGQMVYMTDVSRIEESEYDKLQGLELAVISCLRFREHHSHQSFDEAVAMARRIGAKRTIFIHMDHRIGLHRDIISKAPSGIEFAYDNLVIEY